MGQNLSSQWLMRWEPVQRYILIQKMHSMTMCLLDDVLCKNELFC